MVWVNLVFPGTCSHDHSTITSTLLFLTFKAFLFILSKTFSNLNSGATSNLNEPMKPVTFSVLQFMGKGLCMGMLSPFSV